MVVRKKDRMRKIHWGRFLFCSMLSLSPLSLIATPNIIVQQNMASGEPVYNSEVIMSQVGKFLGSMIACLNYSYHRRVVSYGSKIEVAYPDEDRSRDIYSDIFRYCYWNEENNPSLFFKKNGIKLSYNDICANKKTLDINSLFSKDYAVEYEDTECAFNNEVADIRGYLLHNIDNNWFVTIMESFYEGYSDYLCEQLKRVWKETNKVPKRYVTLEKIFEEECILFQNQSPMLTQELEIRGKQRQLTQKLEFIDKRLQVTQHNLKQYNKLQKQHNELQEQHNELQKQHNELQEKIEEVMPHWVLILLLKVLL